MNDHIIAQIKELLADGNYTQKQLAKELRVGESTMSNILNGSQPITVDQLVATSRFLGIRIEYILGLSPDRDEETHRTRFLIELFSQITTTEKYKRSKKSVITPADMAFSKEGKYTILIGRHQLFSLIDKVADLNSRKEQGDLPDDEFDEQMKKAWKKFSSSNADKRKVGRFLISPKQFEAEEEKAKGLAQLLQSLSQQEI